MVVVEKYPELKANQNFRDLQVQLEGTENRISVERMRFNEVAQTYNTARQTFPTVLFANMMGFLAEGVLQGAGGGRRGADCRLRASRPALARAVGGPSA